MRPGQRPGASGPAALTAVLIADEGAEGANHPFSRLLASLRTLRPDRRATEPGLGNDEPGVVIPEVGGGRGGGRRGGDNNVDGREVSSSAASASGQGYADVQRRDS